MGEIDPPIRSGQMHMPFIALVTERPGTSYANGVHLYSSGASSGGVGTDLHRPSAL
jgi:hypothetical protein